MKKRIDWALIVAVAVAMGFLLGILMPLGVYISNNQEFITITPAGMLKLCSLVFLVIALIVSLLLLLLNLCNRRVFGICVTLLASLSIAIYAQGNVIGAKYPILDGKSIPWDKMIGIGIVNTIIWVLIIGAGLFSYWKWREEMLSVLRNVMFGFVGFMLLVTGMRFATFKPVPVATAYFSNEGFFDVSSTRNVFVIILDTFEQQLFNELLEKHPEVKEELKDFTYYSNTIGKYPTTAGALPHIVTGMVNDNTFTYSEYLNKAYRQSPLLQQAKKLKFDVYLYFNTYFSPHLSVLNNYGNIVNAHALNSSAENDLKVYNSIYKNVLFVYSPHFLKKSALTNLLSNTQPKKQSTKRAVDILSGNKFIDERAEFLFRRGFGEPVVAGVDAPKNVRSNDAINSNLFSQISQGKHLAVTTPNKMFKFMHLTGVHHPHFDISTARRCISEIKSFIDELKQLNVYDRSMIVIAADHGVANEMSPGMSPLFLVNNSSKGFTKSELPFSYDNFSALLAKLLTDDHAQPKESTGLRSFYFYSWQGHDNWSKAKLPKMTIYHYNEEGIKVSLSDSLRCEEYSKATLAQLPAKNFSEELSGRWTYYQDSHLKIPLMKKFQKKDIYIKLQTHALLTPDFANQEVTVSVNKNEVLTARYQYPNKAKELCLRVPKESNQADTISLDFHVKQPVSPSQLHLSTDGRLLGIFIPCISVFSLDRITKSEYNTPDLNLLLGDNMSVEPTGRWSAENGSIEIPLLEKFRNSRLWLTMQTGALVSANSPEQEIEIGANGKLVKTVRYGYPKLHSQVVNLEIPQEINTSNVLKLSFKAKHAVSPKMLGFSQDERILGMRLIKLKISGKQPVNQEKPQAAKATTSPLPYLSSYAGEDLNRLPAENMTVEPNGRWSGETGCITIPLRNQKKGVKITLHTQASAWENSPEQEVEFSVNGKSVKTVQYHYSKSDSQNIVLEIGQQDVVSGKITLGFKAKQIKSPKALGISGDSRILGVRILRIDVIELD